MKQTRSPRMDDASEAIDLRNALLVGGLTALISGAMILGSESGTGVLQIPTRETSLMALSAAIVTGGGLLALRIKLPVRGVAWVTLIAYTVIVSLTVHFTGGPLTPMPALFLLIVVAASFLLERRGATFIAILSAVCYGVILALEYSENLSMVLIWRQEFNPSERGQLLIVNWLAVAVPAFFTAQLAGMLAERLRASNVQLRESEQLRDKLTEMIVHDLRSPLTAMVGGVDILRATMAQQMDARQRELLDSTRRSGQALVGLVEEMLDIGKMEAGVLELDLESTDLRELVQESIELVSALTEAEELVVTSEVDDAVGTVWCDRRLIGRVVANLLANSIKYTSAGGSISLAVRMDCQDAVIVSVADTGIGIPPEYQERVFEKFGLADHPSRGRRGTGLGLAFCKMAVDAHGGRMWVESQLHQGSTFYFTLPAKGTSARE